MPESIENRLYNKKFDWEENLSNTNELRVFENLIQNVEKLNFLENINSYADNLKFQSNELNKLSNRPIRSLGAFSKNKKEHKKKPGKKCIKKNLKNFSFSAVKLEKDKVYYIYYIYRTEKVK